MNLKPIFEKLLISERLTEDERAYLLDWATRADSLTIGTNPITGQISVQSVGPTQPEIAAMVDQALKSRQWVNNLSDLSNQMGLIMAGEFRSGNGKVPGDGFTGGRFGWPGFTYGGTEYFLAGVANDVLQVGLALTDGTIKAAGGAITINSTGITFDNTTGILRFKDSTGVYDGTHGTAIFGESSDAFAVVNRKAGKAIQFYVTLADASTPYLKLFEEPTASNVLQLDLTLGTSGSKFSIGGTEVVIWAGASGKTTVFNEAGLDIDFRIEGDAVNNVFKVDAGFDRAEFGADNYIANRSAANPNNYFNEANQDIDTFIRSVNSDDTFIVDAGLDQVQLGAAVALTGDITPSTLSADQNNYNPTGLSTASVLRLEAASANRSITGLVGGADGRIIIIHNIGTTYSISLQNENASSTAANRFSFVAKETIQPAESITLQYDGTAQRWRATAKHSYAPLEFNDAEGDPSDIGTASDGTSAYAARRDHVHGGPIAQTNTNDIFACVTPGGASLWTGTISGTPSGTSVTVSAPVTGTEAVLVPVSTSQLAKMRLYNLTRGDSALISNYNSGTNVVTLTATVPGTWANGDSLTVASQTVSGGGRSWIDLEITSGPTGKSYLFMNLIFSSATAGDTLRLHPFSASFSTSKYAAADAIAASTTINTNVFSLFNLISNVIAISWTGTPANIFLREAGFLQ